MNHDAGGGGGTGHSGRTAHVEAAEIRALAARVIGAAHDKVADAMKEFASTADGAFGFGGSDAGADLASLHAATKDVFTDTVKGVRSDLSRFNTNMHKAADAWSQSDESSAERARNLVTHLAPPTAPPLRTKENYRRSIDRQGSDLNVSENLQHEGKHDKVTHDGSTSSHKEGGGQHGGSSPDHAAGPSKPSPSAAVGDRHSESG